MEYPFPIDTDLWGEIEYVALCAPGVWHIKGICMSDEGIYAVPMPYMGDILSPVALNFGENIDGVLFFDAEHGQPIIEYELLGHWREKAVTQEAVDALDQKLKTAVAYGAENYPIYFGSLPPPRLSPRGPVTFQIHAADGVYFVKADGKWMLAINFPIWHTFSMEGQTLCASRQEAALACEHMFFDQDNCAGPLYRLLTESTRHCRILEYIKPKEFIAALWRCPGLVERHNAALEELDQALAFDGLLINHFHFDLMEASWGHISIPCTSTEDTNFLRLPQ